MSGGQELTTNNADFIRSLPKAELHLHLEGSVDPETLSELSRRHNTPLPTSNARYKNIEDSGRVLSVEEARALYQYQDFTGFLLAFKAVTERLRTAEDYELITYRLMQKLAAERVLHAEVFVSVGVIFWREQPFDPLFEGMERGRERGERDFGLSLRWIFDAVRQFGPEQARKVAEKAIECRERNVVGFGIGGDERRAAPELFREVYRLAREHGLRLSCHAGESAGPESIRGALAIGSERLGHALRLIEDEGLLREIVERQVPLEICLSSNLRTGCCASLGAHPARRYYDLGACVVLNTDDPEMFLTSLSREYEIAQDNLAFSDEELRQLARNSFRASFLSEQRKQELLAYVAAASAEALPHDTTPDHDWNR
jgi:adenosine deaminase/aminodeoxyfutalosine deaminase